MKKILALILALAMVASLAACAKDTTPAPDTNTNTNTGNVDTNTDANTGSENDTNTETNEPETPAEDETPVEDETPAEPEDNTDAGEEEAPAGEKLDANTAELSVVLQKLYEGYDEELPMLGEMTLEDPEMFSWLTFVEYIEGAEGMVSEPMMGSIAHSFVLVRVPEGTDAADFAAQMEANCDPRKWICVEAEKVASASYGNLALLCMSTEVLVDTAIANFNSMFN